MEPDEIVVVVNVVCNLSSHRAPSLQWLLRQQFLLDGGEEGLYPFGQTRS